MNSVTRSSFARALCRTSERTKDQMPDSLWFCRLICKPPDMLCRRLGTLDDTQIEFKAQSGYAAKTDAAAPEPTRTFLVLKNWMALD
jgi:hypothetical protein